jgi:hypothetical protein
MDSPGCILVNSFSRTAKSPEVCLRGLSCLRKLSFDYLATLDATGADANSFGAAPFDLGLDGTQVDVPATASGVVRVRNVVAELWAFTADCADLSHDLLQLIRERLFTE